MSNALDAIITTASALLSIALVFALLPILAIVAPVVGLIGTALIAAALVAIIIVAFRHGFSL